MLALLVLAALPSFNLAAYERPRVVQQAESVLTVEPKTITAVRNPNSAGGPHDFSSDGDYWWPDPKNPGGRYIQKDGLSNPDNFVAHRQFLLTFVRTFDALAAAYKLTHDEKYAAAAERHLHAWFVDPDTKMNPSLLYSQAIRGNGGETGRSIGVIDTLHLAEVALGVEALRGSKALTNEEEVAVTDWFQAYLTWLTTHRYGIEESKAKNNHGTCAWLQIACFAHLIDDQDKLEAARKRFKEVLMPAQMANDGSFPQELRRTKPYGYSIFNLDVMTALAVVCSTPRENLLTWSAGSGRTLVKGVEWLAPSLADKNYWLKNVHRADFVQNEPVMTNEPIKPDVMYWDDWPVRQPCLIFGALTAGREDWLATWKKLDADPQVEEIRRNFPIRQPVLWVQ
jgi:alginate lyase